MRPIDCVAFLFTRDESFLVEKRRADAKCDPNTLAIPGGHVEQGETIEQSTCIGLTLTQVGTENWGMSGHEFV